MRSRRLEPESFPLSRFVCADCREQKKRAELRGRVEGDLRIADGDKEVEAAPKRQKVARRPKMELNDKKSGLVVHMTTKPFEIKSVDNY